MAKKIKISRKADEKTAETVLGRKLTEDDLLINIICDGRLVTSNLSRKEVMTGDRLLHDDLIARYVVPAVEHLLANISKQGVYAA